MNKKDVQQKITELLAAANNPPGKDDKDDEVARPTFTKDLFFDGMKEGCFKNIVIVTGAGISVSAGIPDFRSPKTGLYANLKEYDLPYPEAIFDIEYFKGKPQAFYRLANEFLNLEKYDATPTHHFCSLLTDKGLVKHYLTQNIDNLESKAGFSSDQVVQAHGANFGATCAKCGKKCDRTKLEKHISDGTVMYCETAPPKTKEDAEALEKLPASQRKCDGPVKPDITFFGEGLPERFMQIFEALPGQQIDLMIVIGTALAVNPFCQVVNMVKCPQVLINMQNTATAGFDFCDS